MHSHAPPAYVRQYVHPDQQAHQVDQAHLQARRHAPLKLQVTYQHSRDGEWTDTDKAEVRAALEGAGFAIDEGEQQRGGGSPAEASVLHLIVEVAPKVLTSAASLVSLITGLLTLQDRFFRRNKAVSTQLVIKGSVVVLDAASAGEALQALGDHLRRAQGVSPPAPATTLDWQRAAAAEFLQGLTAAAKRREEEEVSAPAPATTRHIWAPQPPGEFASITDAELDRLRRPMLAEHRRRAAADE